MSDNPIIDAYRQQHGSGNPIIDAYRAKSPSSQATAPTKSKVQTPKNARVSPLRGIGEMLSLPVSLASAAWESVPVLNARSHPNANYLAQALSAFHGVRSPQDFYRRATEANLQYDPFSDAVLRREGVDPSRVPTWLKFGGELGSQWYNPSNLALGRSTQIASKLAGKGIARARAASPALHDALTALQGAGEQITAPIARVQNAAQQLATRAGITALRAVPGPFGSAMRSFFDRYHEAGLPQRGGAPFVQAAFGAQAAPEHAAAQATNLIRRLGNGLTTAQKREMQRLSYVNDRGIPIANRDRSVPESAGLTLQQRALGLRQYINNLDQRLNRLGLQQFDKGGLFNSGLYWPMRQFGDQPVFTSQALQQAAQSGDELAIVKAIQRNAARQGRSRFSAGPARTPHKTKQGIEGTILNPDTFADLHPEYDPIYQLEQHAQQQERALANEASRRKLETLPSINPQTGLVRTWSPLGSGEQQVMARMPIHYALEREDTPLIFGSGDTGRAAMEKYIKQRATAEAMARARRDPRVLQVAQQAGVSPSLLGSRSLVNARTTPIAARIAEAQRAKGSGAAIANAIRGRTNAARSSFVRRANETLANQPNIEADRMAAEATPRAKITKITSDDAAAAARSANAARDAALNAGPLARAEGAGSEAARAAQNAQHRLGQIDAQAAGLEQAQADRIVTLQQRFTDRAARSKTAEAFQRAAKQHYQDVYESIAERIRRDAPQVPEGYTKESGLGIGSPTGREMALDDSFANFFTAGGRASPKEMPQAKAFWNAMQTLNRISRLSIVLVPTVHGLNNLGMSYLAEGGEVPRAAEILAGRAKFSGALRRRATEAGAITDSARHAFEANAGAHATTDLGERAQMQAAKAGPLAPIVKPFALRGLQAGQVYDRMNTWLFHDVEQGYALDLFDRYTRAGMSDGEAAIKVRNALGRYDNVGQREQMLSRLAYFYPWMKTVIPYWTKKGLIDPRWWEAPERAIEVANQTQGYDDPSRPFTLTMGKRPTGEWRRYTVPVPQRVLDAVAQTARVPVDLASRDFTGAAQDVKAPVDYLAGHANFLASMLLDLVDVARHGTQVAPFNTFAVNPRESRQQQAQDIGGRMIGRLVAPISRVQDILRDPIPGILTYATGGSEYGTKTDAMAAREKAIRAAADRMFSEGISSATKRGDDAEVQRLTELREKTIQQALEMSAKRATQPPAPAAAPTSSSNPFLNP